MHFRSDFARGSGKPSDAMQWIIEMEEAKRIGDLKISESITGQSSVDFEHLDAKIARRPKKIINGDFKRRVFMEA